MELNNVSKETGEITIKQKQKVQKAVQSKVTSGSSSVSSFLVALALCLAPCDLSSRVPCHVFPRPPALREVEGAKRQDQGQKVRARRHFSTQDDSFFGFFFFQVRAPLPALGGLPRRPPARGGRLGDAGGQRPQGRGQETVPGGGNSRRAHRCQGSQAIGMRRRWERVSGTV